MHECIFWLCGSIRQERNMESDGDDVATVIYVVWECLRSIWRNAASNSNEAIRCSLSMCETCTRKRNQEKWLCLVENEEWRRKMLGGDSVDGPSGSEEWEQNEPFLMEVSKTLMEVAKVGTLCTLIEEGLPLGIGVRFIVEPEHGTSWFFFNFSDNTNIPYCLHVQVPHFLSLSLCVLVLI